MCTINSKAYRTYRGQAATHVGIGHREAGLIDGLLKHKVNDSFKSFFCVDCEIRYLLHQLIEHLGSELVQNATNFPEQLLKCQKTDCQHIAFKTTKQALDKTNTLSKETNQNSKNVRASNKYQCLTITKASTCDNHLIQSRECKSCLESSFYCECLQSWIRVIKGIHTWVLRASGSSATLSLFIPGFQAFSDFLS